MSLNVIGLVSGGKDSFFSLLHCIAHGHRIVALANLHPDSQDAVGDEDEDLNSFMYQTVGHQVIPLYADATGLPVYRQPIRGHAVQSVRDYSASAADEDETESMTALLRTVMAAHPDASAVCAGALLSTYQRTRVESVAVRLGLTSLAYMWNYPVLPGPAGGGKADYLQDLADSGFDARIIKVASGGLDESMLWANVASAAGRHRLSRALTRLGLLDGGDAYGSLLGEGGEYETLVVDGPRALFAHGSIRVDDADRHVVDEGGGTAWLRIANASVVPKDADADDAKDKKDGVAVTQPGLFDARFKNVLTRVEAVSDDASSALSLDALSLDTPAPAVPAPPAPSASLQPITTWCILPTTAMSITAATQSIVDEVLRRLAATGGGSPTGRIVRTLVVLRHMADFAAVNAVYGALFADGPPNPPARVTIAGPLPQGVDVAVYFGVLATTENAQRDGLHVQSRSYWAPANIGPYSQAVSVLAAGPGGPRMYAVAGQIPLVPATMELPTHGFAYQATLALQHLWRIGLDVGVQWWGSAVAYVPKTADAGGSPTLPQKTAIVAEAWRRAHAWRPASDDDDDDDGEEEGDGPDLWDRKYDARYAMYGGSSGDHDIGPLLPDGMVFATAGAREAALHGGPVFMAEVGALPRGAPVEWHAHAGYGQLTRQGSGGSSSSVQTRSWVDAATQATTHQTVVTYVSGSDGDDDGDSDDGVAPESKKTTLVQTVEAWPYAAEAALPATATDNADVVYVDVQSLSSGADLDAPVVPCFSLWAADGSRLSAVIVQTTMV